MLVIAAFKVAFTLRTYIRECASYEQLSYLIL